MKRNFFILVYWAMALFLFAVILCSAGYSLPDALFLGTSLLPIAVLYRYLLVHIRMGICRQSLWELGCLSLFILTLSFLIIHLAHAAILTLHHQMPTIQLNVPSMLLNPVFLLAMFLLLIAGDYFFGRIVERHLPEEQEKITFVSDRQPVSLVRQEILYVESCDTETWVHATDNRRYRNKRPISAWADLLGRDFLRIHRSYIVRISACQGCEGDNIVLTNLRLPISRKYKTEVQEVLANLTPAVQSPDIRETQ